MTLPIPAVVALAVVVVGLLIAVAELARRAEVAGRAAVASASLAKEAKRAAVHAAHQRDRLLDLVTTGVGPYTPLRLPHPVDMPTMQLPHATVGARHRRPVNGFAPGAPLPEDGDHSGGEVT